jgi:hypothetical protein
VGGWLKISNANPLIRDIFALTGLGGSIALVGTEQQGSMDAALNPQSNDRPIRLGDLLVEKRLLTEERVNEAIVLQKKSGQRLGHIVVEKGWISEKALLQVLSEQLSIPYASLRSGLYDPLVANLLDAEIARRLKMLPLFRIRGVLFLATADPQAVPGFAEVEERISSRPSMKPTPNTAIVRNCSRTWKRISNWSRTSCRTITR